MSVFFVKFIEPYISDLHFTIYNHNLRGKPQEIRLGRKKISQLSHHRLSTPFSLLVAGSAFAILETESSLLPPGRDSGPTGQDQFGALFLASIDPCRTPWCDTRRFSSLLMKRSVLPNWAHQPRDGLSFRGV